MEKQGLSLSTAAPARPATELREPDDVLVIGDIKDTAAVPDVLKQEAGVLGLMVSDGKAKKAGEEVKTTEE